MFILVKKVAFIAVALMMLLPPCPTLFAWGGDGYLLPGRGNRVAARCANGYCAPQGTWRAARQHRATAVHGYGSSGQHGYSSGYGSAGSSGYSQVGYGSAGQTSYGSAGQTSYQPVSQNTGCENCDCESCTRQRSEQPKETTDSAKAEFKDGLTSAETFKRGLKFSRVQSIDTARPVEMLASR